MTLQEMINFVGEDAIQDMVDEEMKAKGYAPFVPKPALPKVLASQSVHGFPIVDIINEEPFINPNVDFDQLDLGVMASLHFFLTQWSGYELNQIARTKSALECLKAQYSKACDSVAIQAKDSKIPATMVKKYENLDSDATVIQAAMLVKKGLLVQLETRFDFRKKLLNSLSRGGTHETSMLEHNIKPMSSKKVKPKMSKNKWP